MHINTHSSSANTGRALVKQVHNNPSASRVAGGRMHNVPDDAVHEMRVGESSAF